MDPASARGVAGQHIMPPGAPRQRRLRSGAPVVAPATRRSRKVRTDIPIPAAPYLDRKVRDVPHLAEVWSYINPVHALRPAPGLQGQFRKGAGGARSRRRWSCSTTWKRVKQEAAQFMKVQAVWQFFEAERDGNAIHLFAPGGHVADPHLPIRPPGARGRPVPERLHSGRRWTAGAITWRCSW